jgi:hypothetical protein
MARLRLGARFVVAMAAAAGLGTVPWSSVGTAQAAEGDAVLTFSGLAAAGGVRVTVTVPGAPTTDTPIDGGGPTAQVAVDSIGTSTGYAAFPDPGQFAVSIPGLVVGVLAGGAGGLPPITLPSPPNYPFYVTSDASNAPEQSAGAGPWALSASSEPRSSEAQATAGFETGLAGKAALVTSTASLGPAKGAVVAKAVSDLQGLTVGPLTIGQVKSVATETLDSSGSPTPSTELRIVGLRIGGVPVELTPQGFVAGGPTTYPVPLNPTLASVLKSSGITMQFVAARKFDDRVVAPALEITFPFTMPDNVGKFSGTATVVIGSAIAQLSGTSVEGGLLGGDAPAAEDDILSGPGGQSVGVAIPTGDAIRSPATPSGSVAGSTPGLPALAAEAEGSSGLTSAAAGSSSAGARSRRTAGRTRPASTLVSQRTDVRSLYLVVVGGVMVALAGGQFIRRLGVRA